MKSENHAIYQFGIFYPNNIRGVGRPSDILAFFEAIKLVSDQPEADFPFLCMLRWRPIYGEDMLLLFREAKELRSKMGTVPMDGSILAKLSLNDRETKLRTDEADLASVFERIFEILAERAPGFLKVVSAYSDDSTLEWGSVRVGPIEPLLPSELFERLPASAFDDSDPPLWLRDEIFDQKFYTGPNRPKRSGQ